MYFQGLVAWLGVGHGLGTSNGDLRLVGRPTVLHLPPGETVFLSSSWTLGLALEGPHVRWMLHGWGPVRGLAPLSLSALWGLRAGPATSSLHCLPMHWCLWFRPHQLGVGCPNSRFRIGQPPCTSSGQSKWGTTPGRQMNPTSPISGKTTLVHYSFMSPCTLHPQ